MAVKFQNDLSFCLICPVFPVISVDMINFRTTCMYTYMQTENVPTSCAQTAGSSGSSCFAFSLGVVIKAL